MLFLAILLAGPVLAASPALAMDDDAPEGQADAVFSAGSDGDFVIGTGGVPGVFYPAGGALCAVFNRAGEETGEALPRCLVAPTGGSVRNIEGLEDGSLDFAIVQSDRLNEAYSGTGRWTETGAVRDLRAVLALHGEALMILVRADSAVRSFDDLKSRRVNFGIRHTGGWRVILRMIDAIGWHPTDFTRIFELGAAAQIDALCNDRIDAAFIISAHPNAGAMQAARSCEIRAISPGRERIKTLLEANPALYAATVPGGVYPGIEKDVPTIGLRAILATRETTDATLVRAMADAAVSNIDALQRMHPALSGLTPQSMLAGGIPVPMHDGAVPEEADAGPDPGIGAVAEQE